MFSEWLMEQMERNDDIGRFAKLAWDDYTSGCARWYSGAIEWRDHFDKHHSTKTDMTMPLLGNAFRAYANELMAKHG